MVHLPAPSWAAVVAWCGGLILIPLCATCVVMRTATALLLTAAVALSAWPFVRPGDGRLRITFIDVGQGDAALVELPDGARMLIDGGPGGGRTFDVGERVVSPFLWNRAVRRLDVIALSHSDADHAGGLGAVLGHFDVGEFWEGGRWGLGGEAALTALTRARVPRRTLRAGQRMWLGDARVTVVNPDGQPSAAANDDSVALRLDWRGVSVLLTGDLGGIGEARVLERGEPVRAVALKVAHHGSRFSSSRPFLDAARPRLAIVSVGSRNPFRHPTPEALARLTAVGARIYRTDRDGAVILETDGACLWMTRWGRGTTDVFDLEAALGLEAGGPSNTTASGCPEAAGGHAESRRESSGSEHAFVVSAQPLQLLGIKAHAQGEPHLPQDGLDLVQRLLAEVLGLEQFRLRPLDEVGDRANVRGFEAIGSPHRKLQLVDAAEQVLVELAP